MLCVLTPMMGIVYGHLDRGLTLILMLLAAADVYVGNADAGFAQQSAPCVTVGWPYTSSNGDGSAANKEPR